MTATDSNAPSLSLQAACLRMMFDYDPETGILRWRERPTYHFKSVQDCRAWNARWSGKVTGSINGEGYLRVNLDYKLHRVHRIIWAMQTGEWPADQIDHINHDRADNRWCNLRDVTRQINGQNQSMRSDNKSGRIGVCWHRRTSKWLAQIQVDGEQTHLGLFTELEDAAAAYNRAAERFGFHENHGEVEVA